MASIRDVAKKARVSTTAVSFVLNGRDDQLGEETVARIKKAMRELNYRPSAIAQKLASKKTDQIGILSAQMVHPVETFMVSAFIEQARKYGYNVLISDEAVHAHGFSPEDESEFARTQVDVMIRHQVAGIVTSVPLSEAAYRELRRNRIPVVAMDSFTDACDCVNSDFTTGSYLAVEHLVQQGRRRLIFFTEGNPRNWEGVRRAVSDYPEMEVVYVTKVLKPVEAFLEVVQAYKRGVEFDSVYVTSDWLALGVYRALQHLGLNIPDDVAVIGFDNTFAAFFTPPLTTVSQPLGDLGRKAFELLQGRIEQTLDTPPQDIRIPPTLVKRESTGCKSGSMWELVCGVWERDID